MSWVYRPEITPKLPLLLSRPFSSFLLLLLLLVVPAPLLIILFTSVLHRQDNTANVPFSAMPRPLLRHPWPDPPHGYRGSTGFMYSML